MKIIKKINVAMIIPMIIGSIVVIFASDIVMLIIGGDKYIDSSNVLRYLLPAFIFSFYSMVYGWPVLGAISKVKETTMTTIIASIVQIFGLGVLILSNNFNLYGLAISCSLSEITLFVTRYFIYCKNKELFKVNLGDLK